MRGPLALMLLVVIGCQSSRAPVNRETRAQLPGGGLVTLPRLAEDLELDYMGEGSESGVIELSAPPDHVMLVRNSTRALVNGRALALDYPCMRRGEEYVLAESDAVRVRRALDELRATRTEPVPISFPTRPRVSRPPLGTLPAPWQPERGVRPRDWKCIVIHHMASARGSAEVIHRLHRQRGWDGLGYHFVIGNGTGSADGEVEVGYRWLKQIHGAHARAQPGDDNWWNEHGIGICLIGDFQQSPPSRRQMQALLDLVGALQAEYGIRADQVLPHRAITNTLCPGQAFPWNSFTARLR